LTVCKKDDKKPPYKLFSRHIHLPYIQDLNTPYTDVEPLHTIYMVKINNTMASTTMLLN